MLISHFVIEDDFTESCGRKWDQHGIFIFRTLRRNVRFPSLLCHDLKRGSSVRIDPTTPHENIWKSELNTFSSVWCSRRCAMDQMCTPISTAWYRNANAIPPIPSQNNESSAASIPILPLKYIYPTTERPARMLARSTSKRLRTRSR